MHAYAHTHVYTHTQVPVVPPLGIIECFSYFHKTNIFPHDTSSLPP